MNRPWVLSPRKVSARTDVYLVLVALLVWPLTIATARAQDSGPLLAAATDASEAGAAVPQADPGNPQNDPSTPSGNISGPGATKDPEITWKHFPMRVLEDQKDLWLFPTQLARGKHWVPTLAIVGVTGALIALDPHDEPYFRNNRAFEETSEIFSTANTNIVEFGVLGPARLRRKPGAGGAVRKRCCATSVA